MRKTFKADGDFGAYYAAEEWLKENGYSYGSMQRDCPVGVARGDCYISKWYNLGQDVHLLDGVIAEGNKRENDITVIIFDSEDRNGTYK